MRTRNVNTTNFTPASRDRSLELGSSAVSAVLENFDNIVAIHKAQNGVARHTKQYLLNQSFDAAELSQIKRQMIRETDIDHDAPISDDDDQDDTF